MSSETERLFESFHQDVVVDNIAFRPTVPDWSPDLPLHKTDEMVFQSFLGFHLLSTTLFLQNIFCFVV